MGWLGWQSDQPATGVVSQPNAATSVSVNARLGYSYGPRFYLRSFYVTPYCRDYIRVNMTGYIQVSCCLPSGMHHTGISACDD